MLIKKHGSDSFSHGSYMNNLQLWEFLAVLMCREHLNSLFYSILYLLPQTKGRIAEGVSWRNEFLSLKN